MTTQNYNGGAILGGVSAETPDWLGSYNEGMNAAIDQNTALLNQKEAKQRMVENAAAEARRAQTHGWLADEHQRIQDAWGATPGSLGPIARPQGPGLGPMPMVNVPVPGAPIAPNAGLQTELNAPAPAAPAANPTDIVTQLLPEWARMEQQVGLPPNYMETVSMLESSGGTNTGDGKYVGVFQIGPEVAADFGVTPEQLKDPRINSQVAAKLAGRNAAALRGALGREVQGWEVYLAHQQGAGGALALLRNPQMKALDALAQAYGGDRMQAQQAIIRNGGNTNMTAGEFAALWQQKFSGIRPQPFTGEATDPLAQKPTLGSPAQARFDLGLSGYPEDGGAYNSDAVQPLGDLPAGLNTDGTFKTDAPAAAPPAAPANPSPAPAAPAPSSALPAAAGTPGLTPPSSAGDVVPAVSRGDFAGINAPGQGTIAQQIMRTPTGQQTALPDSGQYMVEPAKIQSDAYELQQLRNTLEVQYAEAVRFRDRESMNAIRGKAVEVDAALRLMDNMKSIAALQGGDVNRVSQTLSRLTGGKVRIEPRSDGKYNVYYNGQMTYEGVTQDAFIAALRSEYDQQYQAQVSAALKQQDEIGMEVLKSQLKTNENVTKETAVALRERATKMLEAELKRMDPESTVNVTEGADGPYVIVTPKTGGGSPRIYAMQPVRGVDGSPMLDASGNPKLKPVLLNGDNSVPVQ